MPEPNSHDAAPESDIVIDFDANINAATVDDTTLVFQGMQSGSLLSPGSTFGVSGDVVTLNPDNNFFPGELVQGTITDGILADGTSDPAARKVVQFRAGVEAGSGDFSASGQTLGSSFSRGLSLGDVDGDGDLDAFMANSSSTRLYLNDGSGSFSDSGQTLGNMYSHSVSLGDVDGDGDLDAFVPNDFGPNLVYLNDGSGSFSDSGLRLGTSGSLSLSLGDVDGDGDLDAFVPNAGRQPNRVYLNDGSGSFSDSGQTLGSSSSFSVSLGDVDGDGDLDAFVANFYKQPNRVYLNDGSGSFSDSGQTLGSADSRKVSLGDVDGDGDLDAFVANFGQPNRVYLNDGSGSFSDSGQTLASSTSLGVSLGDVDGDGDLDAFVADSGQPNRVYLNDGSGGFSDSGQTLGSSSSFSVSLGDLDGDGDLDAFVANSLRPNQVWVNGPGLPAVDLSVSSSSGSETSQSTITLTARASEAVEGDQTVDVDLTGTGITTGDYMLSSASITIPDGQTIGTATFTIVDDPVVEGPETAEIFISNPSAGISLGSTTSQNVVIADNDNAGFQLVETGGGTTVSQGGTIDTFDVVLTAAPASDVRFDLLASDTNKASVSPAFLIFGPDNWDVRQQVFVQGSEGDFGTSQIDVRVNDSESNDLFDSLPDMQVTVETLSIAEPHIYQEGKDLFLLGSNERDQISIREIGGDVVAQVISYLPGGVTPELKTVPLNTVEGIEIYGFDGDDTISAIGLNVPVLLDGGLGNDQLTGGLADDILLGGPGADRMIGNAGDDLLLGGDDADLIFDGTGADIVISGRTELASFAPALRQILDEWTSTRSYEQRVDNITNDSPSSDRLNGEFFLEGIIGDSDVDRVFGDAAGQDLFFAEDGVDILLGKRTNEELINTPDI